MKRFIEGEDRTQVTLLPACLEDYVEAENPVRVVEVFVDGLDLGELGFVGVDPAATGRPAYRIAMRSISELNPHGLLTHCVRFAPVSHPTNGNTRYRPARYGFDRAGLTPAGFHQEVSLAHPSSSSSALIPARSQFGQKQI